jgi:hypothetical protein
VGCKKCLTIKFLNLYTLFIVIVSSSIIIIIASVSGQVALLAVADCEPLEEQESSKHPRMDVFLDRWGWLGQPLCETCYMAVTEELG